MNAAVGLMDGLGLDGDRCIRVIPRQVRGGVKQPEAPSFVIRGKNYSRNGKGDVFLELCGK